MSQLLKKELEIYEKEKENLVNKSEGKYVLIKENTIIGIFETEKEALKIGIEKFGNTPFLVKKIELIESKANYTSNMLRCEL